MVKIDFCDLCDMDGEDKRAVAEYEDSDGNTWMICKKHLRLVKEAGNLHYWMLEAVTE